GIIAPGFYGAPAIGQVAAPQPNADPQSKADDEADADDVGEATSSEVAVPDMPAIDDLLDRLAASNEQEGRSLQAQILKAFHHSESDTIDLLMSWAVEAMQAEDFPRALDLLGQVVLLAPDFAEGWNKRATVHFLARNYGKSIADIQKALALQPRHFGALSGLGLILRDIGKDDEAIKALNAALAINPHMSGAREALEKLEKETGGQGI
ncbi:MAG: tetratricopeptide repeat protein, partial [Alphaproteobacteria bacterium]